MALFARRVREQFPSAASEWEYEIAEHACQKYSGRIGRSAAAKTLDPEAVHLAVAAHIRHNETNYDKLLASGWERYEARAQVNAQMGEILCHWQGS